ncbi:MAG: 3-dehydroquinate synthase [Candidatus Omnitrophica bacterium]|nr:3-dehydroquinate synthase [Candidatus Omnitrophota bacterium]
MKTVQVALKSNAYKIMIGQNCLVDLGAYLRRLKIGQDAIIITNPVINQYYGKELRLGLKENGMSSKILEVPDGEKSKSAKMAFHLFEEIARYAPMKKIFIIALGGGVVGDLAGYVAAAYKRGVPLVQVPTTFLAQIDSAIGGKVAIDLPFGKNLVGAFYQPKVVWTDVTVLETLDDRQIRNGFAEAVKYGVIADKELFLFIEENYEALANLDMKAMMHVILRSSCIKADVVLRDEKETKGIRTILNFGHTLGHAIETVCGYRLYHHGEAVALGMRIAADIAVQIDLFQAKEDQRLNRLLTRIGLPETVRKADVSAILDIMKHDKKFISGKNRFVLPQRIGKVIVQEGITIPVVRRAIQKFLV